MSPTFVPVDPTVPPPEPSILGISRSPLAIARAAAIVATLALVIGSFSLLDRLPGTAGAVNLLANPGFELDADGNGRPDAWSNGNLFTRSNGAAHGGTFAGRFLSTVNKGQTSYQQVSVAGGAAYDVSGWVNIPTTGDAFTFQLKVQWRTGSGQLGSVVLRKYTDDTAGAWQEVTASLTAPAGATGARVQLVAAKLNATIYVDDLSFSASGGTPPEPTPPEPPTGGNTLVNAGFETDANGDTRPDAWTTNPSFARSNTVVHGGGFAGRHQGSANAGYTVYQQVGVAGGEGYSFAGHVNAPATSDAFTFTLRVQWRTSSGSSINSVVVRRFTDDTSGAWQAVSADLTAPANAASARVQMVLSSLSATVYVDDLSFGLTSGGGGGDGPENTTLPTISPPGPERDTHYARPGSWTGSGPITYAYQWMRCTDLATCAPITGAATDRYELSPTDIGERLRIDVTATDADGSTTVSSAVSGPIPPRATPSGGDPVIGVAGDISCDPTSAGFNGGLGTATTCRQQYTSDLLVDRGLTAVLTPGDIQYSDGDYDKFLRSYDLSWGRLNAITRPAPGNHEYETPGAAGYYRYFGAGAGDPAEGWYSFDIGDWHVISLNSNCSDVSCAVGSAQEQWLRADLASSAADCTLAYWHHPRFSSGQHGDEDDTAPFWDALYEHGADLVLAGHDHDYERFAPLSPTATIDEAFGIRSFVVGTGGAGLRPFPTVAPGSEVRDASSHGILELTLGSAGYAWEFVPAAGSTFTESGTDTCHGAPDGGGTESLPGTLTATVETTPVPHDRDAADDATFWINPADPALSTVIGTDKQPGGGLFVYDLSGAELSSAREWHMGNVDLRDGFPLGGEHVSLVASSGIANRTIYLYRVDPSTRGLVPVTPAIVSDASVSGLCLYHSALDGSFSVFVGNSTGTVQQWHLVDDGSGQVVATKVREFDVGGIVEGCVADDERGHFYVSEELVGIWRYGAEPDAGTDRLLVDVAGPPGHLTADIEGLVVVPGTDGGYLVASSQGNDSYVIYDRDDYAHLGTFRVVDSPTIDGTQHTDGIDITTAALGPAFPGGAFVAQDGANPGATQNFKLVPWDAILEAVGIGPTSTSSSSSSWSSSRSSSWSSSGASPSIR